MACTNTKPRPSDEDVNQAVTCIKFDPLGMLKNHRNSEEDFLCILPLSLGWPNITIAVEWPLKPILFNSPYIQHLHSSFCLS